jgi:hypothetical protein
MGDFGVGEPGFLLDNNARMMNSPNGYCSGSRLYEGLGLPRMNEELDQSLQSSLFWLPGQGLHELIYFGENRQICLHSQKYLLVCFLINSDVGWY